MNFASGQRECILEGATGHAKALIEQSIFFPLLEKEREYRFQLGSELSLLKVPLWDATSLTSLGYETEIPGCLVRTLESHVVPALGTPSRNESICGILFLFTIRYPSRQSIQV